MGSSFPQVGWGKFLGILTPENWGWLMFTFQPSWWSSPTHLKSKLEFGSFPRGSGVKNEKFSETTWPLQKRIIIHPEDIIHVFFSEVFGGNGICLEHTSIIYTKSPCAGNFEETLWIHSFSFRKKTSSYLFMISKHDFRGMCVFQLLPKNKQRYEKNNKQTHYVF